MTNTVAQRSNYLLQMAEEYQDFKEFLSYKFDLNKEDFNALFEEFEKWSNGEITKEEIIKN